jgi:hypothetical protein
MRQLMACAVEISDAMRYLHSRGMMHGARLNDPHPLEKLEISKNALSNLFCAVMVYE